MLNRIKVLARQFRSDRMNKKGAELWVTVVISLVILFFVVLAVGGAMGVLVRSAASSPENQAVQSVKEIVIASKNVLEKNYPYACEKFEIHIQEGYFIQVNPQKNNQLDVMRDTSSGPVLIESDIIDDASKNTLCCNSKLDTGLCSNNCGGGEPMVIGKNKAVNGDVCVCLNGNTLNYFMPEWYSSLQPGVVTDRCYFT